MSKTSEPPGPLSPDDALPPVEPPSAGFIVQLFVVPAVIVSIIVLVWLLFNWLAHMGEDRQSYINALRRDNAGRWQAAVNLANALRRPSNKLKHDAEFASELSALLTNELEQADGRASENDVRLRVFLSRALGEIYVVESIPALLAGTRLEGDADLPVRVAALQALAVLASNLDEEALADQNEMKAALIAAAGDGEPEVRSAAAYALGVVGGDEACEALANLVHDAAPNVRFNAATGLARHGRAEAVPVLVEMMELTDDEHWETGRDPAMREAKRMTIVVSALHAAGMLVDQHPEAADMDKLRDAVELLTGSDQQRIQVTAREVRQVWQEQSATP